MCLGYSDLWFDTAIENIRSQCQNQMMLLFRRGRQGAGKKPVTDFQGTI